MSNTAARNELTDRLRRSLRLWRYAQARGLSFAKEHFNRLQACLLALGHRISLVMLTTLSREPMAVWSA